MEASDSDLLNKAETQSWVKSIFDEVDECMRTIATGHEVQDSTKTVALKARDKLSDIQEMVLHRLTDLQRKVEERYQIITTSDLSPLTNPWISLGSGNFGEVFKAKYMGTSVAVKVMFPNKSNTRSSEEFILRGLSHENIVAFRGIGTIEDVLGLNDAKLIGCRFIVMEYIPEDLDDYVKKHVTDESTGLSYGQAWEVAQQIASALVYLHALKIAHRDLKPDNILVSNGPIIKLADFGLAGHGTELMQTIRTEPTSTGTGSSSTGYANIRWGAPELLQDGNMGKIEDSVANVDYFKADMYTFAHVVAYAVTGERPLSGYATSRIRDESNIPTPISLPEGLKGDLRKTVERCYDIIPSRRPSAHCVINEYLKGNNPYRDETRESLFFSCGFLENTYIYVADSCIGESTEGFYKTGERPEGYIHGSLVCDVDVTVLKDIDDLCPEMWQSNYYEQYAHFKKMANKKEIDDNPAVALRQIILARPGEEEKQIIELYFKQTTYCHHRAMREIWKGLSEKARLEEVPSMADVHPFLSTSFGLHVAVLTNEGPSEPPMFIFCRRNRVKGMATPGRFTCGAVESVSAVDYQQEASASMGGTKVSLVNTAVRGLKEELGLELTGNDNTAVTLATVYLKFDTHEWGLCGFVDLRDERIQPDHRISAKNLIALFTSGPKDKFEHQSITPVKFELENMVDFVKNNFEYFASSTKLVVVKVLQAFFGVTTVEKAFARKSNVSNR